MRTPEVKAQPPFGLRMPEEIKTWLSERAAENGRSINSEIVQLLKVQKSRDGEGRQHG